MNDNKTLPESRPETSFQKSIESDKAKPVDEKKTEGNNPDNLNKKDEKACCNKCHTCKKKTIQ